MDENHVRFEGAISAASKGNLTWELWPHDMATAVAIASRRNPIGGALHDFFSNPSVLMAWNVVLRLEEALKEKACGGKSLREIAFQAHTFYRDHRCNVCHGNGVTGVSQRQCPSCGGSGDQELPVDRDLRLAISILMESEHLFDCQLRRLLRDGQVKNNSSGNIVHLPLKDIQSDHGFNHDARTPVRSSGG